MPVVKFHQHIRKMKAELFIVIFTTFCSLCISGPITRCTRCGTFNRTCINVEEMLCELESKKLSFKDVFIPTPIKVSGECAHEYLNGLKKLNETVFILLNNTPSFEDVVGSICNQGECAHEYLNGLKKLNETGLILKKIIPSFEDVVGSICNQTSCIIEEISGTGFIERFKEFLRKIILNFNQKKKPSA